MRRVSPCAVPPRPRSCRALTASSLLTAATSPTPRPRPPPPPRATTPPAATHGLHRPNEVRAAPLRAGPRPTQGRPARPPRATSPPDRTVDKQTQIRLACPYRPPPPTHTAPHSAPAWSHIAHHPGGTACRAPTQPQAVHPVRHALQPLAAPPFAFAPPHAAPPPRHAPAQSHTTPRRVPTLRPSAATHSPALYAP